MSGQLTDYERGTLATLLGDSRDSVVAAVTSMSAAQWHFKPRPEVWSPAECCGHIFSTDRYFFEIISTDRAIHDPARADALKGKEKMIGRAMANRTVRVKAPVEIPRPEVCESPAEFVRQFQEARERIISYARETQDPLHERVHPHMLGDFNGLQWLMMLAAHANRHRDQVAEVLAHPDYPKA